MLLQVAEQVQSLALRVRSPVADEDPSHGVLLSQKVRAWRVVAG
jgi:hypothetical protein